MRVLMYEDELNFPFSMLYNKAQESFQPRVHKSIILPETSNQGEGKRIQNQSFWNMLLGLRRSERSFLAHVSCRRVHYFGGYNGSGIRQIVPYVSVMLTTLPEEVWTETDSLREQGEHTKEFDDVWRVGLVWSSIANPVQGQVMLEALSNQNFTWEVWQRFFEERLKEYVTGLHVFTCH